MDKWELVILVIGVCCSIIPLALMLSYFPTMAILMLLPALLNQIEMTTNSAKFEFLYFLAQPIVNKQFQL